MFHYGPRADIDQCIKGQNPRMLCVNVYREDLVIHAARMKADPQRTRDLMGRHRAMSEGIVNNLTLRSAA